VCEKISAFKTIKIFHIRTGAFYIVLTSFQAWQTLPLSASASLPTSETGGEMQAQLRLSKENANALGFKNNILI